MSALAGLLIFDGQADADPRDPASPHHIVQRMLDAMSDRGADEVSIVADGPVVLGVRVGWTTLEAAREHQPVRSTDGRLVVTCDGRLDNREEIARRLHARSDTTDTALLADALAESGGALAALVGDFSLACWERSTRRLTLVRDSLGARPLYYAVSDRAVWWASALQAMLIPPWHRREPNEGFLAEYLSIDQTSLDETPFRDIFRLPQAHLLEVTGRSVTRRQYWTPNVVAERSDTEDEAVEGFRHHFETAVRSRLRAREPLAFHLSGGLDSSSVVAMAQRLQGGTPHTFSLVFPDVPLADESSYIDAAVTAHACHATRMAVVPPPTLGLEMFAPGIRHADLCDSANGERLFHPLHEAASAAGHRVVLTGTGGDDWLTGSLFRTASLLKRGRLIAACRHVSNYRSIPWLDPGLGTCLQAAVLPLLPATVKAGLRVLHPRDLAPWLSRAFVTRVGLDARLRASRGRAPVTSDPVVSESLVRLTSGEGAFVREHIERSGHHVNLEFRHPFYDRRLVEFLLGLADHWRLHGRTHRYVQRRALSGVLPATIRDRLTKPEIDHLLFAAVRAADPDRYLGSLRIVERGWVDPVRVGETWRSAQRWPRSRLARDFASLHAIWQVLAVEAWTRAVF